jgi:hypothetical protein
LDSQTGSLKRHLDGLELGLQVRHVPALHFELVPLAQDLDLLLLDQTALFFNLRADSLLPSHTSALLFSSGACPRQGPLRTICQG